VTTAELDFVCDVCGHFVDDGQGCLRVWFADIASYRAAEREWRQMHGDGPHPLGDVVRMPEVVPWHIHHFACTAEADADGYDIDVAQVRTWRDLVWWTSHLMAKNWLALTDWPQVIGAAAEGRSGRIKALPRGDAA
jgi:hypothetical protein